MAKTVVGLFDNFSTAQNVVRALTDAGFDRNDISLVANNTNNEYSDVTTGDADSGLRSTDGSGGAVAESAGTGAVAGTAVGGVLGLLVGLGALAIPGVGPVIAAGPLAAALGSTALGAGLGAATGGLVGGLAGLGVPEEEAGHYAEGVRRGGALVTVSAPDERVDEAAMILNRHGAVDIDQRTSQYRETGYTRFDHDAPAYTTEQITTERARYNTPAATTASTAAAFAGNTTAATATTPDATVTTNTTAVTGGTREVHAGEQVAIPIVEEQIQVGKREVESGGARIHSRVVETPVEEQVQLREEHVTVERHAVDRPVTQADVTNFREGVIEVRETAEVPVVAKEARVVEEVVIGKEATQRTETVRDTVRRTDIDVDELNREDTIDDVTATTTTHHTTTASTDRTV